MKTNKTKAPKKISKKEVKKQIEHTLAERFFEAVKGLGHNAEIIAEDIAKLSKVGARKLSKKFKDVKATFEHRLEDASVTKSTSNKIKLGKKDTSKLMKKVDKSVTKVVKKAVKKAKPVATSVKVAPLATEKEDNTSSKTAAKRQTTKTKAMANKTTKTSSTTKPVVKAVSNNPVKKVSAKSIPSKTNTDTKK